MSRLVVEPLARAEDLIGAGRDRGADVLDDPPTLAGDRTLADQMMERAATAGLDEPTDLADYAVGTLGADDLLDRVVWPFSRGERTVAGLLITIARPIDHLVAVNPTAGLDLARRRAVVSLLSDLVALGTRVDVASDDPLIAGSG